VTRPPAPGRAGRRAPAREAAAAATTAALVVLSGCAGGVKTLSLPTPPATTIPAPPPPDSHPGNLASVAEAPVPGVTTTTVPAVGPGSSSLSGMVTDQGQPVGGATVEIDRVVGSAYGSARTVTAADGSWSFHGIEGGDYRIRAWMAPNIDMTTPAELFLAAGASQDVNLAVTTYPLEQVLAAVNPAAPVLGQPANLVVQVTTPTVDANGVLHEVPVIGATVTLVNGPNWQVENGNPLDTTAAGQATFEVECTAVGDDPLGAQVGQSAPVSLQMPPCSAPPTTTTTTTTFPSFPTTTTCPPSAVSTTTLEFGSSC
jgi:hypothetical protein